PPASPTPRVPAPLSVVFIPRSFLPARLRPEVPVVEHAPRLELGPLERPGRHRHDAGAHAEHRAELVLGATPERLDRVVAGGPRRTVELDLDRQLVHGLRARDENAVLAAGPR